MYYHYFGQSPIKNNFGQNVSGGQWYFYNPATLSFGLSEFRKTWGKRKLEDDWRRSNKKSLSNIFNVNRPKIRSMTIKKIGLWNWNPQPICSPEIRTSAVPNANIAKLARIPNAPVKNRIRIKVRLWPVELTMDASLIPSTGKTHGIKLRISPPRKANAMIINISLSILLFIDPDLLAKFTTVWRWVTKNSFAIMVKFNICPVNGSSSVPSKAIVAKPFTKTGFLKATPGLFIKNQPL